MDTSLNSLTKLLKDSMLRNISMRVLQFCLRQRKGTSQAEYSALAAFIAIGAIASVHEFGGGLHNIYGRNLSAIEDHTSRATDQARDLQFAELPPYKVDADSYGIENFSFPDASVSHDFDGVIYSEYVDIPGLNDQPVTFVVSDSGENLSPRATKNIVGGGDGVSGQIRWGTVLSAKPPAAGRTAVVTINIGEATGTWHITKVQSPEPTPPEIGHFDFGGVTLDWDDPVTRVRSDYVNIPGLQDAPIAFSLRTDTGTGQPLAHSNVSGGYPASTGHIKWGTDISIDAPDQGQTITAMLEIADKVGTFEVTRAPKPSCPTFVLTQNNNKNHAQVNYSAQGINHLERPFTLSGTGDSNPRAQSNSYSSGTDTDGMTAKWGINIQNDKLKKGQVETITLTICEQVIQWQVSR
jgi:Flp pilus assembly pilin Flp